MTRRNPAPGDDRVLEIVNALAVEHVVIDLLYNKCFAAKNLFKSLSHVLSSDTGTTTRIGVLRPAAMA